ncbi:GNAT family N-acetyltransferase [Paenibacillus pinistramenti]|uniref:GNAT family N-acetyltransferase n=1 Tax=Paenibacillus pinistramenti TaxID=1768003 RepID=UPI001109E308|nr:GNAT family protein [Paenibacillus pinistramenti]
MIRLEYFRHADFAQLMEWISSPQFLIQWGGHTFQFPLDQQQLAAYLSQANTEASDKHIYRVVHEATGKVIGHINLQIDRINNSARVGKVLVGDQSLRGQGIGQRMIEEAVRIAFGDFKVHRVNLGVFAYNHSALACYEKAGFVRDGLLREARKFGDQYWDLWEMSMLENEWAGLQ